jgi:hypothetical protein
MLIKCKYWNGVTILDLNNTVLFHLVGEIEKALRRSGKHHSEIITIVTSSHPEMFYSRQKWDQLTPDDKATLLQSMKNTLNSIA